MIIIKPGDLKLFISFLLLPFLLNCTPLYPDFPEAKELSGTIWVGAIKQYDLGTNELLDDRKMCLIFNGENSGIWKSGSHIGNFQCSFNGKIIEFESDGAIERIAGKWFIDKFTDKELKLTLLSNEGIKLSLEKSNGI